MENHQTHQDNCRWVLNTTLFFWNDILSAHTFSTVLYVFLHSICLLKLSKHSLIANFKRKPIEMWVKFCSNHLIWIVQTTLHAMQCTALTDWRPLNTSAFTQPNIAETGWFRKSLITQKSTVSSQPIICHGSPDLNLLTYPCIDGPVKRLIFVW